jgi:tryptophan-rich sensory protein
MSSSRRVERAEDRAALLGFAGITAVAALAGRSATRRGLSPWYEQLRKPPFQPPAQIFAPVWTVLYGAIALSGWRVYRRPKSAERERALRLWATQLGLNGAWSWLFFGRHRPRASLADSALLLVTAAEYAKVARPLDPTAAWLFAPYLGWLAFATLLNEEIVRRNPPMRVQRAPAPASITAPRA